MFIGVSRFKCIHPMYNYIGIKALRRADTLGLFGYYTTNKQNTSYNS